MADVITRREFIKKTLTQTGLALAVFYGPSGYRVCTAQPPVKGTEAFSPSIWLQITRDNLVTVYVNKSEMGQGVVTTFPMLVAEELEADWKQIRFEIAPAVERYQDPVSRSQATEGSTSVVHMQGALRLAGAAAREMLLLAAARLWEVPPETCEASRGIVRSSHKTGSTFTYGQLSEEASRMPVPQKPAVKQEERFKVLGIPTQRLDAPDKLNGTAVFGMDVYVQDMLFATIVRPTTYGANLFSYDKAAVQKVPGIKHIFEIGSSVVLCADSLAALAQGRKLLNVRWKGTADPELNTRALNRTLVKRLKDKGVVVREDRRPREDSPSNLRKIQAVYTLPYLAHVTMEPMNCTAHVQQDRCDLWVPTQNQTATRRVAAETAGLDPEQVRIYTTYLGGGFGRRLETDFVREAVLISKATGKPVKLLWTREDDLQNDFYRPACCSSIESELDVAGRITSWSQKVVAPSIWERVAPIRVVKGVDPSAVEGLQDTLYAIPHFSLEYIKVNTPVPVGFWRSVGHSHNAFLMECFMDELAHAAEKDPLQFRLELLAEHPRAQAVLRTAAEKAGWGSTLPSRQGFGLARHYCYGTHIAQVAQVSVNEQQGTVRVLKLTCAVDCGTVVNPDGVIAQMEGGMVFGLSSALKERVEFSKGGVASRNFSDYRILTMKETPSIEVILLPAGQPAGGIGAVGVPPVAPAVANAVFAATGARVRDLPLNPENILKALRKTGRSPNFEVERVEPPKPGTPPDPEAED